MKMAFESWCAKNYYKIRECLSLQGRFDEDAFHDAFLSTIRAIRKSGNALDIEGQIKENYQANNKSNVSENFARIRPDELFFTLLPDNQPLPFEEIKIKPYMSGLVKAIKSYVKHNYKPTIALIWLLKYENTLSYTDISDIVGVKTAKVKDYIFSINADIRNHFYKAYDRRQRRTAI